MIDIDDISVIILSAGQSQRFGKAKALLLFNEKKTFIEEIIDRYYANGITNIVIVTNPKLYPELLKKLKGYKNALKIIVNEAPEQGRISSIKCAARHLINQNVFIHNIDNPFVFSEDLRSMLSLLQPKSFVKPIHNGKGGHPVLISNEITKALANIQDYNLSLKIFLSEYTKIEYPTENKQILININTENDYNSIFR